MRHLSKLKKIFAISMIVSSISVSGVHANGEDYKLYPSGEMINVEQNLKLMYVSNTQRGTKLKKNDIIFLVRDLDEDKSYSKDDLKELYKNPDKQVLVTLQRKGEMITKKYKVKNLENASISNSINFNGVITAMDRDGNFIGIGHNIKIGETGLCRYYIDSSKVKESSFSSIKSNGDIEITTKNDLNGKITDYAENGVLGNVQKLPLPKEELELDNPTKGTAYMLCKSPSTNKIEKFEVEITKVEQNYSEIKVTDKKLINLTGGIIQGMNGSPIIQNNKIVGGLRAVYYNDSKRGKMTNIYSMLQGNNDNQKGVDK